MITFEVHGLKEMGDVLTQLPGKIARRALAAATLEGANVIRDQARANAPVGTKTYKNWKGRIHRPGLLRRSGVVSRKLRPQNWESTALYGVGFSRAGFYGKWIERGMDKKHHYAPHPFVVPLLDAMKDRVVEKIKSRLGMEVAMIIQQTPGLKIK